MCPLHAATGLDCPFCGATRAWWFLAHGELGSALRHNAPFVLAAVWLVGVWAVLAWRRLRPSAGDGPRLLRPPHELGRGVRVAAVVALAAFTVARNLPGGEWLAPV